MKNIIATSLLLVAIFVSLAGCKKHNNIPPDLTPANEIPTYQLYYVYFFKTKNSTEVSGFLNLRNEHGSSLILGNDSLLKVNGINNYSYYRWQFDSIQDVRIEYRRKDSLFTNTVLVTEIGDIAFSSATPKEIYRNATTDFTWDGPPIEANEEVSLTFSRSYGNTTIQRSIALDGNNITLLPRSFEPDTDPGLYKMRLTRIKRRPLEQQDNNAGGRISIILETETEVILK
ncbi:MAG: hypothetical protein K9G49_05210 [Taibaiella sp.]|nr:hypothetical protein [Taibaiella sp.]